MLNLIQLEVRRNSLKTYITAALLITILMLGFNYLFAYLPRLDPNDADMDMFMSYTSFSSITGMLSMVSFAILSSAMYAKFVVEEYGSKKAILLFSYPVNRKKIFAAKIVTVFGFTFLGMVVSSIATFGIFYISETFAPISSDVLTFQTVLTTFGQAVIYAALAAAIGLISLFFGMWKNSTPATIISSTIIGAVICNFAAVGVASPVIMILAIISLVVAIIVAIGLTQKIELLEV